MELLEGSDACCDGCSSLVSDLRISLSPLDEAEVGRDAGGGAEAVHDAGGGDALASLGCPTYTQGAGKGGRMHACDLCGLKMQVLLMCKSSMCMQMSNACMRLLLPQNANATTS